MANEEDRYLLRRDEYILDTRDMSFLPLEEPERIVELLNSQEKRIESLASFWMDVFKEITEAEEKEE